MPLRSTSLGGVPERVRGRGWLPAAGAFVAASLILLFSSLWAFEARGAGADLVSSSPSYSTSQTLVLSATLSAGADLGRAVDIYVAVAAPGGTLLTLGPDLRWSGSIAPIASSLPLGDMSSMAFYQSPLAGLPLGAYDFFLVVVGAAADPLDSAGWLAFSSTSVELYAPFDAAAVAADLVVLSNESAVLGDDLFLERLWTILAAVDQAGDGPDLLQSYLETEVLGYPFGAGGSRSRTSTSNATLLQRILASEGYQRLEAFFSSVIFSAVPTPASIAIQATDPERYVAIAKIPTRTQALNVIINNPGSLGEEQTTHIYNTNTENPWAARRLLLEYTGQPVPDYLQAVPECVVDCAEEEPVGSLDGTYHGSYSGSLHINYNCPDLGRSGDFSQSVSGGVTLTVSGDRITVSAPAAGSGTLSASGETSMSSVGSLDVYVADCGYSGAITPTASGGASAGGSFACVIPNQSEFGCTYNGSASGGWSASR